MDILHPWTLTPDSKPLVPYTTFSIAMANKISGGRLQTFVDGISALEGLKEASPPICHPASQGWESLRVLATCLWSSPA